jgi:hypothetical protein
MMWIECGTSEASSAFSSRSISCQRHSLPVSSFELNNAGLKHRAFQKHAGDALTCRLHNYVYSITTMGHFRFDFQNSVPINFSFKRIGLDSIYSSPSIISSSSDTCLTPKRNRTEFGVLSASSFSACRSVLTRRTSLTAMWSSFSSGCSSQLGKNPHPAYSAKLAGAN